MDEDLQFKKAEYQGEAQTAPDIPPAVTSDIQPEFLQEPPPPPNLPLGALYAIGTAIACSIGYAAIVIISKYELAIISIAVGYLIGTAAVMGAGNGSRALQVIAVASTYVSICGSMFFMAVWELMQAGKSAGLMGNVGMLILSMGKPIFDLQEGFGGILGIAILAFGLLQAWQRAAARSI
jgi:hypothetical protein